MEKFASFKMREKENMGESREKIATLECEQRFIIKPNSNFFATTYEHK